jgi:hypothetical protein
VFSTVSRHPPTILRLVNCWSLVGTEIIPDQPFLEKIANERLRPFYDVFDHILDDGDSSSARRANGCSECEFQTLVFRAVWAFTHATTLRLLEWCSQHLDSVMSGKVEEPSRNPACFDWCRLLYEEGQKNRVSEHECASILNRSAAVVEQSARMQGVRVE